MRNRRRQGACPKAATREGTTVSIGTILLIILILALLGVLPTWPHSRGWGYYPTGGLGIIIIIIIVLLLLGRL